MTSTWKTKKTNFSLSVVGGRCRKGKARSHYLANYLENWTRNSRTIFSRSPWPCRLSGLTHSIRWCLCKITFQLTSKFVEKNVSRTEAEWWGRGGNKVCQAGIEYIDRDTLCPRVSLSNCLYILRQANKWATAAAADQYINWRLVGRLSVTFALGSQIKRESSGSFFIIRKKKLTADVSISPIYLSSTAKVTNRVSLTIKQKERKIIKDRGRRTTCKRLCGCIGSRVSMGMRQPVGFFLFFHRNSKKRIKKTTWWAKRPMAMRVLRVAFPDVSYKR